MSLGQRVIATQRVYILAQGSPPNQAQPAWRLMNMKVQEEFVHFFHNVDSFREIQEEKIPVTDVTAFPALSLMLDEIGITPSMGTEAISKILTKSLGACPPLPQLIRNSTEDKQEPSNLTGPQKRKKDLSKLVGTIIYNKKKGEEQKSMVLFFESLSAYRAVSKAIENAVQWVRHYYYCLQEFIQPNKYFLNWIVESSNDPNPEHPPFLIDLSFFKQGISQQEFKSLELFLGQFRNVWAIGFQTVQKYSLDMIDLKLISRLFVMENQISMLSLAKCQCSDNFFSGLFTQLEQYFPNIITLNLSSNYLTDSSLDTLAAFITSFQNLETLDISHNFFSGENTAAFSNLLLSLSCRPVKDDFYHGVKLFASYNLFTDAIIQPFEEAVLFSTGCQFFYLDFSFNSLSSYGLWRIFSNLKCRQEIPQFSTVQETLVINLYPLPFNADILNSTVNYFYTLYAAKSMYEDKVNKEYQMLMRSDDIKLYADNKNDQSQQQQQNDANSAFMDAFLQQTDKSLSLMLTRKRLQPSKPLPNKVAYIKKTKQMNEEILRICKSKEFTIEQLMEFCQEIYDLEFEFPLAKLEPLQRIVKDILEEAFLIRDHYSIHILSLCCEMIGIDWAMLRHSHDIVQKRKAELIQQIESFLTLKFLSSAETETSANAQFDRLVSECLRMDLRGTAVDILFLIKQKRDQMIIEEQNSKIAQGELEELKRKQVLKQQQEQLKQSQQLLRGSSSQKVQKLSGQLN